MLDKLAVERELTRTSPRPVVAATGTGKTVVAALDYRDLCRSAGRICRLLFVAHRRRILDQSRAMFGAVLRNESFGELLGDDHHPEEGRQVFAMVQSLDSTAIDELAPDAYDVVVIIDEFHHAAAPTYRRLLEHLQPKELLGLTATPERMDGQDITEWFGGRIAVELRLWEAIDQGFLSPFQYFGIADGIRLCVIWNGVVAATRLPNWREILTGDDMRVAKLLEGINSIVASPQEMRALGFWSQWLMRSTWRKSSAKLAWPPWRFPGEHRRRNAMLPCGDCPRVRYVCSSQLMCWARASTCRRVDTVLLLRPTQSATVLTAATREGSQKGRRGRVVSLCLI